jgi:ornithine cyclodeaminase
MRFISAAEIDRLLDMPAMIAALDRAFRGGIVTPVRHHHHIARPDGDATLLLMPAWTDAGATLSCLGTKIVTVFPGNAARGLPSVAGLYLLMDGATGAPLAAMDGARLTLWRTAAASALAARAMAAPDARRLLMVGAGALSRFLIKAHRTVRPIDQVMIWNRSPGAAAQVAAELRAEGVAAEAVADLEAAARQADIVSCATLTTTPLISGDWLKAGAHLDLVGAFTLGMREADNAALARACVVVDTPAAFSEGGDVAVAIKAGAYEATRAAGTLTDLAAGRIAPSAPPGGITLFKSVGAALEDLAAAMLVWRAAQDA